jgi:glycosyltransferase involved in cell wall biosynthesis
MYIAVSGGRGQFYDIPFLLAARLGGLIVYIHHHNFSYAQRRSVLAAVMLRVAGSQANHIVMCEVMGKLLCTKYSDVTRYTVVSVAAMTEEPAVDLSAPRQRLTTLGYFGHVSVEKGVREYLRLLESLARDNITVRGIVGGGAWNHVIQREVESRLRQIPGAEYVGPVYGADKWRVLSQIDCLVFPSRYKNEAEPAVIYEALSCGTPVIAFEVGCITAALSSAAGLVIPSHTDFLNPAMTQIQLWLDQPETYRSASIAARDGFKRLRSENASLWAEVIRSLAHP